MSRYRIALTVPSLRGGGLERVVRDLALTLQRRGHPVAVFPVAGLGVHEQPLRNGGIPVFDCQERGWRIRGYPRRLIGAIRQWGPDVLHAHSGTWYAASMAARMLRAPSPALVFTDHGRYHPEPWTRAWTERWAARRTDRIATVSSPLADYVERFLRLPERPRTIPNGIDLAPFQRVAPEVRSRLRAEWKASPADPVAIVVGRFVPVKNHTGILQAFAGGAPASGRLVLLGSGPLEGAIRGQVDRLGLGERVRFLGFRSDVAACLAAADLWVSGSTTEGLPIALLEAMAAGLPILATAVGGVPEALGEPPAGVLVDPEDSGGFARTLGRLLNDGSERDQLSERARARSLAFSLETMADRYCALYEEAVLRRSAQ